MGKSSTTEPRRAHRDRAAGHPYRRGLPTYGPARRQGTGCRTPRILPQMSDSLSLLWSPVLMMRQSDPHCLDWRCRSYWCRSFPDCGFAAVFLDRAAANPSPSASMGVMGGYSGPAVNGGGHNASWRVDRRMGSLGFHRCQRNACSDRRCDCIPVPCSSEDMDFSSDRDRGGNDGDRRLRGSVALTDHLTEGTRPAMSSLPPFKTIRLLN